MHDKSKLILKAIVAGQSCEQILGEDRSLTYHDVFLAAGENPASKGRRHPPAKLAKEWASEAGAQDRSFRSRVD